MTQNCEEFASGNVMAGWIDTNAITQVTMKTYRIRWTIENVSKVAVDTNLTGPDFFLMPTILSNIAFKKNDNNIFVYVCNKSDTEIQIERNIYLCNCNNEILHQETNEKVFTLEKDKRVDIIGSVSDRSRYDVLPNNTLIIDLSINMKGDITTKTCGSQHTADPRKKLIEDLKTMQENSVKYDVSLQIGNERIPAHWSILCSRSPYFKKMFDSEMSERVENSIIITDISLCSLKKLIKFLYTAEFGENDEDSLEELFDLYYASDKYEVLDLRTLCSSKIMSTATPDNVCRIFQLANRHNDKDLKLQAMDFIKFHSGAVFQTDGWKKFDASEPLSAEIFSFCLMKNKFVC